MHQDFCDTNKSKFLIIQVLAFSQYKVHYTVTITLLCEHVIITISITI